MPFPSASGAPSSARLNLFRTEPGLLTPEDASVTQGLADVATIGILHERTIRENSVATEQLQHALDSRVVIEQAKGVLPSPDPKSGHG